MKLVAASEAQRSRKTVTTHPDMSAEDLTNLKISEDASTPGQGAAVADNAVNIRGEGSARPAGQGTQGMYQDLYWGGATLTALSPEGMGEEEGGY